MKVFNLACEHDHRFEGWFGSADDYDTQLADGRLERPLCGSGDIRKMPAAPRLNLSAAPATTAPAAPSAQRPAASPQEMQAMFVRMARHLIENTEDVGERFAEEARRIHYRESPERSIRGIASREEAQELTDEGIEVFAFPLPAVAKEPLQ
jgi:hypothetical protein